MTTQKSVNVEEAFASQLTLPALTGTDEEVAIATEIRSITHMRIVRGLSLMPVLEVPTWVPNLQAALNALTDASWWLDYEDQLTTITGRQLVESFAFLVTLTHQAVETSSCAK